MGNEMMNIDVLGVKGETIAGYDQLKNGVSAVFDVFQKVYDIVKKLDLLKVVNLVGSLSSLRDMLSNAQNILENINFQEIGNKINGLLNELFMQITNVDWVQYAVKIGEGITGLFTNIDWALVGTAISTFVKTAIEMIGTFFATMDWSALGNGIITALSNIDWWGILTTALGAIDDILMSIFGNETVVAILEGLAFAIGAVVIAFQLWNAAVAIWSIIGPAATLITNAFNAALLVLISPIGLIVLAIAAVIAIVILLVKNWDTVKAAAGACWEWIKGIWSTASAWINEKVVQPIANFFTGLWTGIKNTFSAVGTWFSGVFSAAWNGIVAIWGNVKNYFSGVWEGIKSIFSNISSWFGGVFSSAWQAVKNVFSAGGEIFAGIKDGILNGLKAVVNAIINGINTVIRIPFNGINSALRSIRGVNILGARPFSWISEISIPQIPRLAKGGVIPPNKEFLAVLGDQRQGTNIETPLATMLQAFKMAFNETKGEMQRPIIIQLDGETLMRVLDKRRKLDEFAMNGAII